MKSRNWRDRLRRASCPRCGGWRKAGLWLPASALNLVQGTPCCCGDEVGSGSGSGSSGSLVPEHLGSNTCADCVHDPYNLPRYWQITLSGITDDACDECDNLNGVYIVEFNGAGTTNNCCYRGEVFGDTCGDVTTCDGPNAINLLISTKDDGFFGFAKGEWQVLLGQDLQTNACLLVSNPPTVLGGWIGDFGGDPTNCSEYSVSDSTTRIYYDEVLGWSALRCFRSGGSTLDLCELAGSTCSISPIWFP